MLGFLSVSACLKSSRKPLHLHTPPETLFCTAGQLWLPTGTHWLLSSTSESNHHHRLSGWSVILLSMWWMSKLTTHTEQQVIMLVDQYTVISQWGVANYAINLWVMLTVLLTGAADGCVHCIWHHWEVKLEVPFSLNVDFTHTCHLFLAVIWSQCSPDHLHIWSSWSDWNVFYTWRLPPGKVEELSVWRSSLLA